MNFFRFWFRFIYKYKSAIEIENYEYVKRIVQRDFSTFSGKALEKYFIQKLQLTYQYSAIGSYWERGNKNEIDIVAVDDENKNFMIDFAIAMGNYSRVIIIATLRNSTQNLLGFRCES